jgi:hypothetical protein
MRPLIIAFAVLMILGTSCKQRAFTEESAPIKAVDVADVKKLHNDFEKASNFTAKSADFTFGTTEKKESEIWACQTVFFNAETQEWEKDERQDPIVFKKTDPDTWKVLSAKLRHLNHIAERSSSNNARIYPKDGLILLNSDRKR